MARKSDARVKKLERELQREKKRAAAAEKAVERLKKEAKKQLTEVRAAAKEQLGNEKASARERLQKERAAAKERLDKEKAAAKERLRPALDKGNIEKTMTAPATAIIGYDLAFYEKLPLLAPHGDMRAMFAGKPALIEETAKRNSSLQGAYLMLAARALGLDCGPMSGFDRKKVDAEFFPHGEIRSNFLCNIGYGDKGALHPRQPRLAFDDACDIV